VTALAILSAPQPIRRLRRQDGFAGIELLALLVDCRILFKIDSAGDSGLRPTEGDDNLVLWDFHDLLFHTRSTQGRHANPFGGVYPHVEVISPLPVGKLLRERHSTRIFDDQRPVTLAELARLLDSAARVQSRHSSRLDIGGGRQTIGYAARPYPSAGAAYELELYLAVDRCEGLQRGFYHYDAGGHALVPISVGTNELAAMLKGAELAMGAPAAPHILITIAARFGRMSWKYSSLAYALILKDVGVLTQTLYLLATDMRLGGCAIGSANIDLFAKMTGIDFHVEGPVGQFAIGRNAESRPSA
jgi:SagB-type dehydrogenase family enzyme